MSTSQHGNEREADNIILPANDLAQRGFQLCRAMRHSSGCFG
jgi:hypothetical protein